MATHFRRAVILSGRIATACGREVWPDEASADHWHVDCGACRRTRALRAVRDADPRWQLPSAEETSRALAALCGVSVEEVDAAIAEKADDRS